MSSLQASSGDRGNIGLLFSSRRRSPYYIRAPQYDERSAGNRALYLLCHALNRLGEEAYISLSSTPIAPSYAALQLLRTPVLTQNVVNTHYQVGLTPIIVSPETFALPSTDAVRLVFALNYLGVMGSRLHTEADQIVAYSQRVGRSLSRCDGLLFIPVSDPDFWTPGSNQIRGGPCVYAGKYVDLFHGVIPERLSSYKQIARSGKDAPTREQLRELFRSSSHCYVFENTALAIEAVLCGCPVVFTANEFSPTLLAAIELGMGGIVMNDSPSSLDRARRSLPQFRVRYERKIRQFDAALRRFVTLTQRKAAERVYSEKFPLDQEA